MSITATNYLTNGVDLSNVFVINYPVTGTPATGYTTSVDFPNLNLDLADIFEPQTIEPTTYLTTNYIVNNYTPLWSGAITGSYDLGQIFSINTDQLFTTTGSPIITSGNIDISGNTTGPWSYILIFTGTSGSFTAVNSGVTNVNFIIVGGGGGGGGTYYYLGLESYGGGGGGGNVYCNSFNPDINNSYTITVGQGGTKGTTDGANSTDGSPGNSSFISSVMSMTGGSGGGRGTDQAAGNGGDSGNSNSGGLNMSFNGGGGGGFGGNGGNATSTNGGSGGSGISITVPTLSVSTFGAGGAGGNNGTAPSVNTGSGGGNNQNDGAFAGADGIVILYF